MGDLMKTLCVHPHLRPALAILMAMVFCLSGPTSSARAQSDDATAKHFDRIERQLREVRDIVLQARSTGQPVEIKMAGPDPEIATLRTRIDDLELTLRQTTGQIDSLSQELAKARRDLKALESDNHALQDRMAAAEGQLASAAQAATQAAAQAPKPAPEAGAPAKVAAPVAAPKPQAAVKAPVAATAIGERTAAFQRAKQLLLDGQFPAASAAFQDYVDQYGDTAPNGPEARYWLGETLFIRGSYADAAAAYIGAIRGWPPTVWGAEAVVKLSMSLIELKKTPDACRTLDEFGRRYPAAAPATKARADKARLRAKCA
ncbi:MAG: tol-pal system protein YbgF [Caulobacteraceae bacterium]|nr:tol-pal system protein YbgF [Caulobacteraceae bacterium]